MQPAELSWLSRLPDDLLELCLAACPQESRGSLRLVCKRNKHICDGSKSICTALSICDVDTQQGPPRDAAALARVARLPFRHARLPMHVPGVLEAAQHLTGLTCLDLRGTHYVNWPQAWLPSGDGATYGEILAQHSFSLAPLTHLQHLTLTVDYLQPSTCAQLSALAALRQLTCDTFEFQVPGELWASLARMPLLEKLAISVQTPEGADCDVPGAAWEALRGCTQLSYVALRHEYLDSSIERGFFNLAPGIASLTSLRQLEIDGSVSAFGDLWSHPTLSSLTIEDSHAEDITMPPGDAVCMPALEKLMILSNGDRLPHVPHQFSQLSAVTSLGLLFTEPTESTAHYWTLPGLVSLDLTGCALEEGVVPEGVRHLTGLRALNLGGTDLEQLPDGPYLWGLRTLLLADNDRLMRLPPVLRRAKQLEVLDLWHRQPNGYGVQLELADLAVLQHMPALRMLCVPARDPSNGQLAALFSTWLPRLNWDHKASVSRMTRLFPRGWDGGMDEDVFAESVKANRQHSLAVGSSVLQFLGRQPA